MNENSGSGRFGLPYLPGYAIEWDEADRVFVATHEKRGHQLRGKDQVALNAARSRHIIELSSELLEVNRYAATHGLAPPPQPFEPPGGRSFERPPG